MFDLNQVNFFASCAVRLPVLFFRRLLTVGDALHKKRKEMGKKIKWDSHALTYNCSVLDSLRFGSKLASKAVLIATGSCGKNPRC